MQALQRFNWVDPQAFGQARENIGISTILRWWIIVNFKVAVLLRVEKNHHARLTIQMATVSETYPTPFATPEAQNFNKRRARRVCSLIFSPSPKSAPQLPRPAVPKQDSIVLARQRLGQKQGSFGRHAVAIGCSPMQPNSVLKRGIKIMKKMLAC